MSGKQRITLADVAAVAGVSKMTASRGLRGASDVSESNAEKVRQAAKDIGYVGNHLASSLSGQQSDLIGVVIPSTTNIVFAEVLAGIASGIDESGMQPVFGITDYDLEKEYEVIRNMLSWNPAGLIATGLDQSDETRRLLENSNIPIVQIMDLDGTAVDACVGFSHIAAGEEMAKALIEVGRKRIGYVGCNLNKDTRASKRLDGFKTALSENGLDLSVEIICESPSTTTTGRDLTGKVLSAKPDLDSIYYSNDDLAAGGAFYCIANGIEVPQDITLAGFNGLDLVKSLPVKVATSITPRHEIGKAAAEHIVRGRKNKNMSKGKILEYKPLIEFDI